MRAKLTAALALALLPAAALAQGTAASQPRPLTRADIGTKLDTDYADLDSNKDGRVIAAEINARLKKEGEADLAVISKQRDAAFAQFDTDKNGTISRAEFDARAQLPKIREPDAKPFLDRFDGNKDGAISKDEFRAPTLANFTRYDSNKDGTLSVAEQEAAAKAMAPATRETPPVGR